MLFVGVISASAFFSSIINCPICNTYPLPPSQITDPSFPPGLSKPELPLRHAVQSPARNSPSEPDCPDSCPSDELPEGKRGWNSRRGSRECLIVHQEVSDSFFQYDQLSSNTHSPAPGCPVTDRTGCPVTDQTGCPATDQTFFIPTWV